MKIHCPTGMIVEARPWSLDDMGEMAIRASQPNVGDDLIVDAVTRQHVATVDPGPYPFVQAGDTHFDWKRVLKADLIWALYRIRAGSFPVYPDLGLDGEDYTFDFRCPDPSCDGHHKPDVHKIRLCDLQVRALPASSFEIMRSGKSFETKVAGKLVRWVLATSALDAPLREHVKRERKRTQNPKRPSTLAEDLAAQITWIEDVNGSDRDLGARAKWLGALSIGDWAHLRDEIIRAAPLVRNKADVTCEECGRVTPIPVPLFGTFFSPKDPAESILDAEEKATTTEAPRPSP
jgi:hypothetical protein